MVQYELNVGLFRPILNGTFLIPVFFGAFFTAKTMVSIVDGDLDRLRLRDINQAVRVLDHFCGRVPIAFLYRGILLIPPVQHNRRYQEYYKNIYSHVAIVLCIRATFNGSYSLKMGLEPAKWTFC